MKTLTNKILITLVLVLCLSYNVFAQDATMQSITLKESIQKAILQNPDLKQYSNQVQTSTINYQQSKNDLLPDLSATASASKSYRNSDASTSTSVSTGLSSGVNVFNGFGDVASIRQSLYALKADELTYEQKKQDIIYQTIQLYFQAILDQELIRIKEENMASQTEQLNRIQEFYDNGNKSLADVLQQRSDLSQAELELISAKNAYELSRLNFLEILGETPDIQYTFIPPADGLFGQKPEQLLLNKNITPEFRLDWKAQQQNLLASDEQINISKSAYWPSVGLNVSAATNYSSGTSAIGFVDQMTDTNPSVSAGLSFSLPIFNRFQTKNNVQLAKIQKQNTELEQEKLNLAIRLEIKQAQLEMETAVKQKDVAKAQLDYARQAYEVTEARYNVGSATYVELSQLRASRLSAENDALQAKYDVALKNIALYYQQGSLTEKLTELSLLEN